MTPTISDIIDQIHTARDWLSAGDQERHGKAVSVHFASDGILIVLLTGQHVRWKLPLFTVLPVLFALKDEGRLPVLFF